MVALDNLVNTSIHYSFHLFFPNFPFPCPLKTSKIIFKFFDIFEVFRKVILKSDYPTFKGLGFSKAGSNRLPLHLLFYLCPLEIV